MIGFKPLPAALVALLLTGGMAHAETRERMTVLSNDEAVGHVEAVTEGDQVSIDYFVDNNGRGPKHRETLTLDPSGVPLSWSLQGSSLMGAPVSESYRWSAGHAVWQSQADSGDVPTDSAPLYIGNDVSPWALGIYARIAIAAPDRQARVLPGGTVRAELLRNITLGTGDKAVRLAVYGLYGLGLAAELVALDEQQHLFAVLSGGIVIRTGYEGEAARLSALATELTNERAERLQQSLAHEFTAPVRIRNVRILDPEKGVLGPLSTVVVMGQRISRILPGDGGAPPADEVIVEGQGGTLMPGLHDMHSHSTVESGLFYLAAGVTTTRDLGNSNDFLPGLMRQIEQREIAGPRIFPAGFIEGRSEYSMRMGFLPETLDEAKAAVNWYADRGYGEIKLYNSFNPDWVKPLSAHAHGLGLRVTGHVPAFSTADRVAAEGFDSIAHINQFMLGWLLQPGEDTRTPLRLTAMARAAGLDLNSAPVRHTIGLMQQHHVALDTTAVILERLMLSRAGRVAEGDAAYLDHMPIGYQRYRKRSFVNASTPEADRAYRDGFAKVLETIALLDRSGVRLLPGTDDITGFTVQRELELYVKAGLSPARALHAGTLGAASFLGAERDSGSIARGKLADMVLIAGNPLEDIRAIRTPMMVLRAGTIYFPEEIYPAFGIRPFAAKPQMTVPPGAASKKEQP